MEISDVQVRLAPPGSNGGLLAYASAVVDDRLAVHDIRVIRGPDGPFLAFPCRKLGSPCPGCGRRCPYGDRYCGSCGSCLPPGRDACRDCRGSGSECLPDMDVACESCRGTGRRHWHVDVVHPLSPEVRGAFESAVLGEYARAAVGRSV